MSDNLTTEVVEDQADAPAEQAPVPKKNRRQLLELSLIHISEPTRPY